MSRRVKRERVTSTSFVDDFAEDHDGDEDEDEEDEEDEDNDSEDQDEIQEDRKKKPKVDFQLIRENEDEDDDTSDDGVGHVSASQTDFGFSQQTPELSQQIQDARQSEVAKLERMDPVSRENAITSVSRLVLFKALAREPIDRTKIVKDAGISNERISTAVFTEVAHRLDAVFGFDLERLPKFMEEMKSMPTKCKNRFYVCNGLAENLDGKHSKAIHSMHKSTSTELGLLMLVLALGYCKGTPTSDGSRWILDRDLYRLLHDVDEGIPNEPPVIGTTRQKNSHQSALKNKNRFRHTGSLTPNVDALLDLFLNQDYLIREKATDDNFPERFEDGDFLYSMGPRSALEIGRRQIIVFCAEILDEAPDPTMLQEVEAPAEEADDDEEEAAEE